MYSAKGKVLRIIKKFMINLCLFFIFFSNCGIILRWILLVFIWSIYPAVYRAMPYLVHGVYISCSSSLWMYYHIFSITSAYINGAQFTVEYLRPPRFISFPASLCRQPTTNQPTEQQRSTVIKTLVHNVILFFLCFLCLNSFDFCVFTYLSYPIQGNPQHWAFHQNMNTITWTCNKKASC